MCVENLICSQKIACFGKKSVFSTTGFIFPKIVAVLLQATGIYSINLRDSSDAILQTISKTGSGAYEFGIFKDVTLNGIYSIDIVGDAELFELNFATMCLCSTDDC